MPQAKTMRYFEEWAKDKSLLIKNASLLAATSGEKFLAFLTMIKSGKRIKGYVQLPPIREWLSFYRNHRKVYQGVTTAFRELGEESAHMIDLYEEMLFGFHMLKHITTSELEEIVNELNLEEKKTLLGKAKTCWLEIEHTIMNEMEDTEEENQEPSKDEMKKARQFFCDPAIVFYIRVWIPCFLLYGEYPPYLLRKARSGDEDALDKLLRLDKSVLDDPKIMDIFHRQAVAKATGTMTLMTKAIQSTPKAKIEIQRIKYLLAGFLSMLSIVLHQKLPAAEIHRLFDAVARDTTGELVDPDLIVSPETFEKAVQRARTFWQIIPQPDKK